MNGLGRLLTAMVTPFDGKGAVDYEQAKKLALALLSSGSDGVVLAALLVNPLPCLRRRRGASFPR